MIQKAQKILKWTGLIILILCFLFWCILAKTHYDFASNLFWNLLCAGLSFYLIGKSDIKEFIGKIELLTGVSILWLWLNFIIYHTSVIDNTLSIYLLLIALIICIVCLLIRHFRLIFYRGKK
jgi:hypothetical protein